MSWVYVSLHHFGVMPAPLAAFATLAFCLYPRALPGRGRLGYRQCLPRRPPIRAHARDPGAVDGRRVAARLALHRLPLARARLLAARRPARGICAGRRAYSACPCSRPRSPARWSLSSSCGGRWQRIVAVAVVRRGRARRRGLAYAVDWTTPARRAARCGAAPGQHPAGTEVRAGALPGDARYLRAARRRARSAQLVVLPETAIPRFLDDVDPVYLESARGHRRRARRRRAGRRAGARPRPAATTTRSSASAPRRGRRTRSRTWSRSASSCRPGSAGWSRARGSRSASSRAAQPPAAARVAGQRVAVNICYEDAFGEEIIRPLPAATLLVNVSNVAWFGDSLAPAQHLRIARMRAVETGRYMLRATNTGVTAIVAPDGVVAGRLPSFTEGVLEGQVTGSNRSDALCADRRIAPVVLGLPGDGRRRPASGAPRPPKTSLRRGLGRRGLTDASQHPLRAGGSPFRIGKCRLRASLARGQE